MYNVFYDKTASRYNHVVYRNSTVTVTGMELAAGRFVGIRQVIADRLTRKVC